MPGEHPTWYAFVRWLVRTAYFGPVTGGLESVGEENIPSSGALIVAPLHVSNLDPSAVACAMSRRRLRFMAKEELFKGLFGSIISSLGAYPVRRGEGDTEAIRKTVAMLQQGEAVLVFPEGTRGDGEQMGPINRGAAMLAKRTGALVMPVGVIGSHIVAPKGRKGRRHRITVAFGEPFRFSDMADRDAFADELGKRIAALCHAHGYPIKIASSNSVRPASPDPEKEAAP